MSKGTILIVDDEISNIEIMNAVLEDDYDVCFSMSGEQALETASKVLPDLILLDVMMPGIDGFEVCRLIKNDPILTDIPVIFTTGLGDTEDETRGLSLGAIDYVTKPIQPSILRARVANHIELKRLRDQLATMAVTDALTGLSNRRQMERALSAEVARSTMTGEWLSVIMLDIDFFKQYNDTYGHPAGDRCLAMVAAAINRALKRASEVSARYGGEEFACILPGTTPDAAKEIAFEIHHQVQSLNIPHEYSQISPILTLSIGVACARARPGMMPDIWLKQADEQLYQSKRKGRNRVSLINFSQDDAIAENRSLSA